MLGTFHVWCDMIIMLKYLSATLCHNFCCKVDYPQPLRALGVMTYRDLRVGTALQS